MLTFIVRRTLLALLTIWALSVISFIVIQLPPGDFVDTYILDLVQGGAQGAETTPAMLDLAAALRTQFGLDRPMYVQYSKWIWKVVRGDLGRSLVGGKRRSHSNRSYDCDRTFWITSSPLRAVSAWCPASVSMQA